VAIIGYGGCLAHKKPWLTNVNEPWEGRGSYHDGDEIIHAVAPGAHIYGINIFKGGWSTPETCASIRQVGWSNEKEELSRQLLEQVPTLFNLKEVVTEVINGTTQ
jgi:hypothetical protein